jgi:predicted membrane-bound spermidine synthase
MDTTILKACYYTFMGWTSSVIFYFAPIHGLILALTIAFFISFMLGVLTGIFKQGERLEPKKGFSAIYELAMYFVLIAALFVIGDRMENSEWICELLRAITWGMIYFYVTNWTKNLKRLFPGSRGFSFLHFILGLEFLKKVPILERFVEHEKNNQNEKSDNN